MTAKPLDLPPQLARLYEALRGRGDVAISDLYDVVLPNGRAGDLQRHQQQWLGPYVTKLNRRLRERREEVKPGRLKGTYVLARV